MIHHLFFEFFVEIDDKRAVFLVHRLKQRVEMLLDMGEFVLQVVLMRLLQILQNVVHGTLSQLLDGGVIVGLDIDAADKGEERQRNVLFGTELLYAFLAKTKGDTESWEHG